MRLVVSVLGRRVLEISTDAEPAPPSGPSLEATGGGQFEIGFSAPPRGEVVCREGGRR